MSRFLVLVVTVLVPLVCLALLVEDASALVITACDTCDEYLTYSGRNVLCCLAQNKCCGPTNFDEVNTKPENPK